MSDSQSNPLFTSKGPACEGKVLIIEVMGTEHPDPHQFRLFDQSNQQQQEWLEGQVREQSLDEQVLHVWPWEGTAPMNVWLDIAAGDGDPIRVPLFDNVWETTREFHDQWNCLWPMVPVTLLHDPRPEPGWPDDYPVPVRPGYLYIFRDGVLWRELAVTHTEAGQLAFSDVRLLDYRPSPENPLSEDRRPAIGQALQSIWLPVRGMNQSLTGVFELAFSEVQWSADRVAHLEENASARAERCTQPGNPSRPQEPDAPGQWATVKKLPAMRTREPYLEQHLPQPWKSVYDLSGSQAGNLYQQAVEEQQAFAAGGESAESAWEAAHWRDARLRGAPSVRVAALEAAKAGDESGNDETALWESLGSAPDALASVRKRGWGVLVLDDPLFRVRQTLTQAVEAQRYLTTLTETVSQQPHTDSAQLVYRVMGPQYLGGKENPLHGYLDEIDTSLFSKLHQTLHTAQRALAAGEMALGQQRFVEVIEKPGNQQALADLFSLTGADYIEGFALAQSVLQALAMNPRTDDRLRINAANVETAYTERAHQLLIDILAEGSNEPLHAMLFPADDGEGNAKSPSADDNCGDGRCRPEDVQSLSRQLPTPETLQTLTAMSLAGIAKQPGLHLATEGKRWAAAVNAILDGVDQHARAVAQTLKDRAIRLNVSLHGPLLRFAKAREPGLLGAVQLITRASVPPDWVILGVHDPAIGLELGLKQADREYIDQTTGPRRFHGAFYDTDGKLLAAAHKNALADVADTAKARHTMIYAAPSDAEVVKAQRTLHSLTRWQDWADQFRVPYLVLALEVWNIGQEKALLDTNLRKKGLLRTAVGGLSAIADLGFAGIMAAERLSKSIGVWKGLPDKLNQQAFGVNKEVVGRASKTLAKALPDIVTRRLLGGIVAGGLTITVSVIDMVHEWDTGDAEAAVANGVSAIGGGMALMGALMGSALAQTGIAPVLLGLGPVGWVVAGLTLAIGGGTAAVLLDDPPLMDWLKRGPFGDEQDDAYSHLRDNPAEVYYRLLGLLSNPRITIEPVHDLNVDLHQQGYQLTGPNDRVWSRINTKVTITNNLAALLDGANLDAHLRPVRITERLTRRGLRTRRDVSEESANVILEQSLPTGTAYYMTLPREETVKGFMKPERTYSYTVAVRAQWQADWRGAGEARALVFPAPELSNDLTYDPDEHGAPDFNQTDQPFWATENTHKPGGAS